MKREADLQLERKNKKLKTGCLTIHPKVIPRSDEFLAWWFSSNPDLTFGGKTGIAPSIADNYEYGDYVRDPRLYECPIDLPSIRISQSEYVEPRWVKDVRVKNGTQ